MRRKHRSIYYICSGIKDYSLISIPIEAETEETATNMFQQIYGIVPEIVLGAFYKKQYHKDPKPRSVPKTHNKIKFNPMNTNQGTYGGWSITYIPTTNPEKVFVFFDKRIDGKKIPKPKNSMVNIKDIIPNEKIVY